MKHSSLLLAAVAALALVSGCASELSGSTYSRSGARAQQAVYHGTITRLETVKIEGTEGVVGGIAGGVLGAVVGSTIGGGRGRDVASAVGGIAGAAVGASAEKAATGTNNGLEITVKLTDGSERVVVQTAGTDSFYVGQAVRLIVAADGSRVRPE